MKIEKLIEAVRLCGSTPKVDQCKQCAYWSGGDMSKCIPRMTTDAATALSTLQVENEKLRAELGQVKAGRDAAIEYLREIEWCAGCKHFGGLDGCKKWAMGQCTEKHDLYEFIGPQKED